MTEADIQTINKEEHQDEEYLEQKIIFDNSIFEQIKEKELDLSVAKIFEIPIARNWFKRQKEEYYVVSQREHIIDCKYTKGKAKISIINKRIINKEIQDIKAKNPIKYIYLGGTEILIKVCFREGIDTPIEIYLADDRIIQPLEKSIISAVRGKLIYQKFKFIISANYSVAINDRNIDKSLGDQTMHRGTTRRSTDCSFSRQLGSFLQGLAHLNFTWSSSHLVTRQVDMAITRFNFLHTFSLLCSSLQISVLALFLNPYTLKSRVLHQLLAQNKHLRTLILYK
ncbi:hypothetical protein MTR67_002463 [Solanum verrucosum]|uniref:Uncharacterized protein n=1 Tax=Solanum verrucosum TaxID=315347 RepID=A0AAF0PQI4_SOLVR|nr:hypothetical protein MTR67_002463 [Solanum verrucosum]